MQFELVRKYPFARERNNHIFTVSYTDKQSPILYTLGNMGELGGDP